MVDIKIGAIVVKDPAKMKQKKDETAKDEQLPDLKYRDPAAHRKFVRTMRAIVNS